MRDDFQPTLPDNLPDCFQPNTGKLHLSLTWRAAMYYERFAFWLLAALVVTVVLGLILFAVIIWIL
jgi:hypothetical protein